MNKYFILIGLVVLAACHDKSTDETNTTVDTTAAVVNNGVPAPQNLTINPIGIYPHDTSSFTEGLQIYNGKLYEGAGDFANSDLQISDIKTGKVLEKHKMGTPDIF